MGRNFLPLFILVRSLIALGIFFFFFFLPPPEKQRIDKSEQTKPGEHVQEPTFVSGRIFFLFVSVRARVCMCMCVRVRFTIWALLVGNEAKLSERS